ncbi:MAG TPA: BamA/TamA family outer membrane protein [Vicinamibacteria bacterium]|nr:BamA/TamA family outer membrane protein [Vicinamibacteria bacterium]
MRLRSALVVALFFLGTGPGRADAQDGFPDSFQLVLGDLRPGAGVSAGADYEKSHFATSFFDLRLSTRISTRLYQRHEAAILIPHFFEPRLFLEVLGQYRSFTEVSYFGMGRATLEEDRSDYHIEGPILFATLGFRSSSRFVFGGRFGMLENDLHSGRSSDLPSVEEAFPVEELPGFVEEPDYLLYSAFAALDGRNDAEDPTRGYFLELQATSYRDRGFDRFNFEEATVEAHYFVPLDYRTVLASRVRGVFTRAGEGQEIPFYLLPTLGGTRNLQAFETDRFRDRNSLLVTGELRYQATPEIRLEASLDVGQVFPSFAEARFSELEVGAGVGARYKMGRKILVGVSLGVGREGARFSMTGGFRF